MVQQNYSPICFISQNQSDLDSKSPNWHTWPWSRRQNVLLWLSVWAWRRRWRGRSLVSTALGGEWCGLGSLHAGVWLLAEKENYTRQLFNASIQINHTGQLFNASIEINHTGQLFNASIEINHTGQLFNASIQINHTGQLFNASIQINHTGQLFNV